MQLCTYDSFIKYNLLLTVTKIFLIIDLQFKPNLAVVCTHLKSTNFQNAFRNFVIESLEKALVLVLDCYIQHNFVHRQAICDDG